MEEFAKPEPPAGNERKIMYELPAPLTGRQFSLASLFFWITACAAVFALVRYVGNFGFLLLFPVGWGYGRLVGRRRRHIRPHAPITGAALGGGVGVAAGLAMTILYGSEWSAESAIVNLFLAAGVFFAGFPWGLLMSYLSTAAWDAVVHGYHPDDGINDS